MKLPLLASLIFAAPLAAQGPCDQLVSDHAFIEGPCLVGDLWFDQLEVDHSYYGGLSPGLYSMAWTSYANTITAMFTPLDRPTIDIGINGSSNLADWVFNWWLDVQPVVGKQITGMTVSYGATNASNQGDPETGILGSFHIAGPGGSFGVTADPLFDDVLIIPAGTTGNLVSNATPGVVSVGFNYLLQIVNYVEDWQPGTPVAGSASYDPTWSVTYTLEDAVTVTPEPSSWILMLTGLALIGGRFLFLRRARHPTPQ